MTLRARVRCAEDTLGQARPCAADRVVLVQMSYYRAADRCLLPW